MIAENSYTKSRLNKNSSSFIFTSRTLEAETTNTLRISNFKYDYENPDNNQPEEPSSESKLTGAQAAGIAAGVLVVTIIVIVIIICVCKKQNKNPFKVKPKPEPKKVKSSEPATPKNDPKPPQKKTETNPLINNQDYTRHSAQTNDPSRHSTPAQNSPFPSPYQHPMFMQSGPSGQNRMPYPPMPGTPSDRNSHWQTPHSPMMMNPYQNPQGNSLNINQLGMNAFPGELAPQKGDESELRMYEIDVGDVGTYGQKKK